MQAITPNYLQGLAMPPIHLPNILGIVSHETIS